MSKRRGNGEGSVQLRKDGRWECSIMIGFQKDGRRKRKSFYGRTKKEALEKLEEYRDDMKNGLQLDPKLLFGTWADTWFESHKENISLTTQESYGYLLDALKDVLGKRKLMEIRALDIENVLLDFRREGKSDSYISKARGMLFQIMKKAEANELIRRNPVACAEKMRSFKPAEAKEAFTEEEVKELMSDLPTDWMGNSIRLMLSTGIRMQELLALEPYLIEPDGSVIHIRQAVKVAKGKVSVGATKSRGSNRDVPIPMNLRPLVSNLRNTGNKYIFQSPVKEQPYDPKHYREKFKDYVRDVGEVRALTPHSCRHTYVSQMQALGVDLPVIQSIVGHADLDMTQHYLHVQNPVKQKAVQKFDQAFCQIKRPNNSSQDCSE